MYLGSAKLIVRRLTSQGGDDGEELGHCDKGCSLCCCWSVCCIEKEDFDVGGPQKRCKRTSYIDKTHPNLYEHKRHVS